MTGGETIAEEKQISEIKKILGFDKANTLIEIIDLDNTLDIYKSLEPELFEKLDLIDPNLLNDMIETFGVKEIVSVIRKLGPRSLFWLLRHETISEIFKFASSFGEDADSIVRAREATMRKLESHKGPLAKTIISAFTISNYGRFRNKLKNFNYSLLAKEYGEERVWNIIMEVGVDEMILFLNTIKDKEAVPIIKGIGVNDFEKLVKCVGIHETIKIFTTKSLPNAITYAKSKIPNC